MDFYEVIRNRESIRSYDPAKPVEQAVLNRILEAGRIAPSAANRQPWHFLLITSGDMLEKVRPCYPAQWFHDAPHILVVVGKKDEAWVRKTDGYNSLETDVTIAMAHMILASENEGVGTCWIAAFNPDVLEKALDLKENERVYAITPLGYPAEDFAKRHNKQRKPLDDIVKIL